MESLEARIGKADKCWARGLTSEQDGELQLAYQSFTEAHDLISDCAKHHQKAHEHLRRINHKIGNYGELIIDWLLHLFAPLGVFELVSYFAKTEAFRSALCKRNNQQGDE